jgi:serine/threonine protein kinase
MSYEFHQSGETICKEPGLPEQGHYQILGILGEGNSGITYRAQDLNDPERAVALKVMSLRQLTDWKMLDLFEREANVLAKLRHPGIPRYLNSFAIETKDDRRYYIAQTLAEGQSLEALVRQGWRTDESMVRKIAQQILSILVYLQKLDPPIIHRDIKPQNIIWRENGSLSLVDFGAVRDTYYSTLMRGSTVVGTYGYMAPEQFRGQSVPATDLYGLGATLLFLLTHRSPAELPQQGLHLDFRDRLQVSEHFISWLEKLLEPDAGDRFESAQVALDALKSPQVKSKTSSQLSPRKALIGAAITISAALVLGNTLKWRALGALGYSPSGTCSDISVLRNYLNQGGSPNAFGMYNWGYNSSPRQLLFCAHNLEMTELLLQHGANPNVKEKDQTILSKAIFTDGNPELVKLLLKYGANPNYRYHIPASHSSVNSFLPTSVSIFSAAVENSPSEMIVILIEGGADINAENSNHETALDIAARTHNQGIVELLISKGAIAKRSPAYVQQVLRQWNSSYQYKY